MPRERVRKASTARGSTSACWKWLYVEGDPAAIAKENSVVRRQAGGSISAFGLQAANLNALGQLSRRSGRFYLRAAETALSHGLPNAAARFEEADARADALSGNCATDPAPGASRTGAGAVRRCPLAKAEKLAAETSKLFPNGTIWNAVQLPEIRACYRTAAWSILPGLGGTAGFRLALRKRAYPGGGVRCAAWPICDFARPRRPWPSSRRYVDHKGASWASTWQYPNWGLHYSLSYLGLARAYELTGDTVKAREAFQDLFALWKDADQDLPILKQAQAEYAKLQ